MSSITFNSTLHTDIDKLPQQDAMLSIHSHYCGINTSCITPYVNLTVYRLPQIDPVYVFKHNYPLQEEQRSV